MMVVRDAKQIDVMRQIIGKRIGIRRLQDLLTPMERLDPRFRQGRPIPHMIDQSGEVELIAALPDQIDQR